MFFQTLRSYEQLLNSILYITKLGVDYRFSGYEKNVDIFGDLWQ